MLPSFPSVTFPNHWTLATGLLPESHGIVSNTFWDPITESEFHYTDPARSLQHHWWGGEPIWMTAEKAGLSAAVHMWPGSEAPGWGATIVDNYNGTEILARKVDRVLNWLDLPPAERPQFIAAYVPDVDVSGHKFGPNTTETNDVVKTVDTMLHNLFLGLEDRNLTEIVNIVIVSDHGMASTDKSRLIFLEDLVDTSLIEHIDGWPLYGLRPYPNQNLTAIYDSVKAKSDAIKDEDRHWDVYLRDNTMPERWHFSKNPRIAPLWIVPETGWAIVTKTEYEIGSDSEYHPRGIHGYDNLHPLMRAIFVARGPAFRHLHGEGREYLGLEGLDRHSGEVTKNETLTKGKVQSGRVAPFGNAEVYKMVCDSLGLEPSINNATLGSLKELKLIYENGTAISPASSSSSSTSSSTTVPPASISSTSSATTAPASTQTAFEQGEGAEGEVDESIGVSNPEEVTETPPEDMGWWDYLKWKAQKIKEKLEAWWQKFGSGTSPAEDGDGEGPVVIVEVPVDDGTM
jgi:hypothetical protein